MEEIPDIKKRSFIMAYILKIKIDNNFFLLKKKYNQLTDKEFKTIKALFNDIRYSWIDGLLSRLSFRRHFQRYYVLYDNKKIIGYCCCFLGMVRSVVIKEEFRNKGLGSLLLENVLDDLQRSGYVPNLYCEPELKSFYDKLGYEVLLK